MKKGARRAPFLAFLADNEDYSSKNHSSIFRVTA